jgi:hypothetical protein
LIDPLILANMRSAASLLTILVLAFSAHAAPTPLRSAPRGVPDLEIDQRNPEPINAAKILGLLTDKLKHLGEIDIAIVKKTTPNVEDTIVNPDHITGKVANLLS